VKLIPLICILTLVILAACGPVSSGSISRVTPLAENRPTSSPPSPTLTLPPEPATATQPSATPQPLENDLPLGSAMQIAAATDIAIQPTPRSPIVFDTAIVPITFDEFYDGYNLRTGLVLSDKLVSLDGGTVTIDGYMAPPLKPELDYFVLTRVRLAFCPFCSTAGDWPDDIALVYLVDSNTTATDKPVRVTGRMEVGASIDQETGMVSLVRVYAEALEIIG
jgi:hypothetical protein